MIMGKQVRGLGCSVSVRSCESCRWWWWWGVGLLQALPLREGSHMNAGQPEHGTNMQLVPLTPRSIFPMDWDGELRTYKVFSGNNQQSREAGHDCGRVDEAATFLNFQLEKGFKGTKQQLEHRNKTVNCNIMRWLWRYLWGFV